jgi:molybdenum cofactor synthesis domain-containing protein
MIKIGILSIGNEILDGIIEGSNAHWMTQQILAIGGHVEEFMVVRDLDTSICRAINRLLEDDLSFIITTGGLGPTHDDVTVASIAKCLNKPLLLNEEAKTIITRQYQRLYEQKIVDTPDLLPARLKMAMLPKGGIPLDNTVGGAPGVLLDLPTQNTQLVLLPGVPNEMKQIFTESFIPLLLSHIEATGGGQYHQAFCEVSAPDESTFSPHIDKIAVQIPQVYIKSLPKPYGTKTTLRVWVSARADTKQEAVKYVEKAITLLKRWKKKKKE